MYSDDHFLDKCGVISLSKAVSIGSGAVYYICILLGPNIIMTPLSIGIVIVCSCVDLLYSHELYSLFMFSHDHVHGKDSS